MDRCAILDAVRRGVHASNAVAFGLAVALAPSCSVPAFECQSDDQCVGNGQGICQPQGYCSFPSDDCESGQQFAEGGGPLAGKCVPPTNGTTGEAEPSSGGAEGSTTGDDDVGVMPSTGEVANGTSTGTSSDDTTATGEEESSSSTGEPVDPDLLLWLRFDEAAGTYQDSSQFGLSGSCEPGACPEEVPGAFGEAVRFNGEGEHLTWPHASHFEDLDVFTFSTWVFLEDEPSATGFIVGKPEGTRIFNSFELFFLWSASNGYATLRFSVSDGVGNQAFIAPPYPIGEWFNVAGTWDGQTCTLFVEGVERDTEICPGYVWSDHSIYAGCDNNSGDIDSCFKGSVDDVRLYSRVLSHEEMFDLATTGAP